MARIVITETASADQIAILEGLNANAGKRTAVKFRSLFAALYDRLAVHPAIGPRRVALGPGIRIGIVTPYLVIYRHSENDGTVTILRIVDARRDITDELLSDGR
jgi:toxin ParE1/3/4